MNPASNSLCREQSLFQPHRQSRARKMPENFGTMRRQLSRTLRDGHPSGPPKRAVTIQSTKVIATGESLRK